MMSRALLSAGLLAATLSIAPGLAQPASLVADLATGAGTPVGSAPEQITALGEDRIVFVAAEPGSGKELWASDGTAAGTQLLADLCPGPCGSGPDILGTWHGAALFLASRGDQGRDQIWRSDGTRGGTMPLRDGGDPLRVFRREAPGTAVFGGFLYFEACGTTQGCGLWRTDGTPPGTRLVRSRAKLGGRRIEAAAAAADGVFLVLHRNADSSSFLWRTDGTDAGTMRLAMVSSPRVLTPSGRKLFFAASGATGEELWVSDGTRAGSRPLTSFRVDQPFGDFGPPDPRFVATETGIAFAAHDGPRGWEIWQSDGTAEGTRAVTDFAFSAPFGAVPSLSLSPVKGRLLIPARDNANGGWSLWASDGRSMVRLHDCLGGCSHQFAESPQIVAHGNRVLFTSGPGYGHELWSTDGTAAGTRKLFDACAGAACSSTIRLTPWSLGGLAVVNAPADEGDQLWTTDGTAAGTRRLTHLPPGTRVGSLPVAAGSKIFFSADHGDGLELWVRENGAEHQAANLASDAASSWPTSLVAVGSHLVFQAGPPDGARSLWQTEGTAASTSKLIDPFDLPSDCDFTDCFATMAAADGWLAIVNTPRDGVSELWRTDGTAAGTYRLLTATAPDGISESIAAFQGIVIFFTGGHIWRSDGTLAGTFPIAEIQGSVWSAGGTGTEVHFLMGDGSSLALWRSDGTAEGTVQVAALPAGEGFFYLPPVRAGHRIWFEILTDGSQELWSSDGTAGGTAKVTGEAGSFISHVAVGDMLYFLVQHDTFFYTLERSDGTPAGTFPLGTWPEIPVGLTAFAGQLFFSAPSPQGTELWSSDGTAAGTKVFRNINPDGGSLPYALAVLGDRLYFSAFDPIRGFELWSTDGTSNGTHPVQDIVPGPLSSAPDTLTAVGGRLYFTADDGITGRELWTLSPGTLP